MSDKMFRECPDCGAGITICAVSEFHNTSGFNGYSYAMNCKCGMRAHVDGCDGDEIPESMKIDAARRRRNQQIHRTVDLDRRELPHSDTKVLLRQSKISAPKLDIDGAWVVYRTPSGAEILFSAETATYTFRYNGNVVVYEDFKSLVNENKAEIAT